MREKTARAPNYENLITRSRELGPFTDDRSAARALAATFEALRQVFSHDERELFTRSLPVEIRRALPTERPCAPARDAEFYPRVALAEHVSLPLAVEHAQVVCRAIGELLPNATLASMRHHHPAIGPLFAQPEPGEEAASTERMPQRVAG
jgi:uncharacterized protein (DUF2267 family)